jgi:predicted DNA-binding transcriptional regulator AlpA
VAPSKYSSVQPQQQSAPRNRKERRAQAAGAAPKSTQQQASAGGPNGSFINPQALLRLPQVLSIVPVGKSLWWREVKAGRFPAPIKIARRVTCWRASDILALIEGSGADA